MPSLLTSSCSGIPSCPQTKLYRAYLQRDVGIGQCLHMPPQCLSPSLTPAHPILPLQAPRPRSLTIVNIVVQFVIIKQSRYQRPCLLRLSPLRRPGNLQRAAFPEEFQGDLCVRCYVYSCKTAFLSKE